MTDFLLLLIALLLAVNTFVRMRSRHQQEEQSGSSVNLGEFLQPVLIVCGDCSGDGGVARKTLLSPQGRCEACGGNNYILASTLGVRFYTPTADRELRPGLKQGLVYADYCYDRPVN